MKTLKFGLLTILSLLFFESNISAQSSPITRLKSMTLNDKAAAQYKKKKLKGLKIDSKGKLTPTSGFKLGRTKDKKNYYIIPVRSQFTTKVGGFDKLEGAIFTYYCMCEEREGDDCKWKINRTSPHTDYDCEGSCGCYQRMLFNSIEFVIGEEIY